MAAGCIVRFAAVTVLALAATGCGEDGDPAATGRAEATSGRASEEHRSPASTGSSESDPTDGAATTDAPGSTRSTVGTDTTTAAPPDTSNGDDAPTTTRAGGPATATTDPPPRGARPDHLAATPRCEEGTGLVDLTWVPATGERPQRVDVTIRADGFETGQFDSSASLGADDSSLVWDQPQGQAVHYWRVVAGSGAGQVTSGVASFEGPSCPVDMQNG